MLLDERHCFSFRTKLIHIYRVRGEAGQEAVFPKAGRGRR
jgi:hypothetical protein